MAGKKQKKKRRANRIENFLQNRLALLATIILSTALVAALGYIIYYEQAEENRVLDSINQLGKQSENVKANIQLLCALTIKESPLASLMYRQSATDQV